MQSIKLFLISLVLFLLIDFIWLGFIAKGLYQKHLGHLLSPQPNWFAAFLFYILFILALNILIIQPMVINQNLAQGLFHALVFGMITYATYDLTNLATLREWPIMVTVIDLLWGMFISTFVTFLTFTVHKFL